MFNPAGVASALGFMPSGSLTPNSAIAFGTPLQILRYPRIVLFARRTTRFASAKSNVRLLKAFAKSAQSQSRFLG
jgi:hypothetical protein